MMLLAASAETARGWGGPVALLVAWLIFRVGQMVAVRMGWIKIDNPSPTPELPTAERVKVHSTVGFTHHEPDEPALPERGWWGEIKEVGGVRFRQARQVFKTGDHELPPADDLTDEEPADEDPEIDLALDDEPEPAEEKGETAEEYIARARKLKLPYSQIVQVVVDTYGLPRSTAKHRIRKVDAERAA